jgi:glycogen phosphorylase
MRMTPAVLRSKIVYMSMEIGLDAAIPTYSGGLGVLAGDVLRSAADLHVPIVGISLLHRKGYFRQQLTAIGQQSESPVEWDPSTLLAEIPIQVQVTIQGRTVHIRPWLYEVKGITGHAIPVYLLDTDLPQNSEFDRTLTNHLYGGDEYYRLCQEAVLGLGGVAAIHALGRSSDMLWHMNEGHSALLTLALLERRLRGRDLSQVTEADVEAVRTHCIFTTHTPVPAGHDVFPMHMVRSVLGDAKTDLIARLNCSPGDQLNMTSLALFFSRYINGVAMKHGEVSRGMFPTFPINAITNGVHALTWTSAAFQRLFDRWMSQWRRDNNYLRYARGIPLHDIRATHLEAKRQLLAEVERRAGTKLHENVFTIGYARRAAVYKRAPLLFSDPERLRSIAKNVGPLQVIYAGKAHPKDEPGKSIIRDIFRSADALKTDVPVVYLEDYDMTLARDLVAGVDLWLNTPLRPLEASGTSGMKAAMNGVPSLSVLDGWWIEGHFEGHTGWSIGSGDENLADATAEIASLYSKLEAIIVPMFYEQPDRYAEVMRSTIAINGSFFNTQRMILQYLSNAYFPADAAAAGAGNHTESWQAAVRSAG